MIKAIKLDLCKERDMYRACIFDLDGTLTDTLDSLTFSVNESLKEMQLATITREQCRAFVGNGAKILMERAIETAGGDVKERISEGMEIYGRIFDANCTYHVVPYDGICDMIEQLQKRNVKLAVLSNKPHKQTVHVVGEMFGKDTFAWVQGQKEGVPKKPDPAAAVQIAEMLGVTAGECMYVGDSEVDVATGSRAGMKTVGVTWGFRNKAQLIQAGAECTVDLPAQILEFITE